MMESFPRIEEYPNTHRRFLRRVCGAITVEPAMFMLALSYGLTAPTHQALIYRKICVSLYNDTICDNLYNSTYDHYLEETQKNTARFDFYSSFCFNVPALLAVALYGSWSDKFSRKIPLLFAPIGSIINVSLFLTSSIFIESNVNFLLIGQFLDGLTGGFACFLMAAFSYTSTVSTSENRTSRISLVYAFQTLAFAVATFTSGVFLDNTSYTIVYGTILIILFLMILYIIFFVKDITPYEVMCSNPEAYDRLESTTRVYFVDLPCCQKVTALFRFSHMRDAFIVTFKRREGRTRRYIVILVSIALLIMITYAVSVNYLFYRHPPLSLTQTEYGYFMGYSSLVHFTSQLLVLPLLTRWAGVRDEVLLIVGLGSEMLARLWTGLSVKHWMLILTPFLGYMQPFNFPCIRALMSKHVNKDEYGKIFAVIAWLETVGALGAGFLYGKLLYPATLDVYAGISFVVSAALMTAPLMLASWLFIQSLRHASSLNTSHSSSSQATMDAASKQVNDIIEQMDRDDDMNNYTVQAKVV